MKNKNVICECSDVKALADGNMKFEAYGNTKNFIDHANDKAVNGAYKYTLDHHKSKGTMPLLLVMHNGKAIPVGVITSHTEDHTGYKFEAELNPHHELSKALWWQIQTQPKSVSFSIGYSVVKESRGADGSNELESLFIKEVSFVNFACNEESQLVGIKSKLEEGELPSKRELEKFLTEQGLSKRQAEKIVNKYTPECDVFELMAKVQ